jgi:hypothetical protein
MGGAVVLRYAWPALRADYLRAGGGLAMSVAAMALAGWRGTAFVAFLALGLIFLAFAGTTAFKQLTRIVFDESGVTRRFAAPKWLQPLAERWLERRIAWDGLARVRLSCFAGPRAKRPGVTVLRLKAGKERLAVDHGLEAFDELVERALAAADAKGLEIDAVTQANLARLGYS